MIVPLEHYIEATILLAIGMGTFASDMRTCDGRNLIKTARYLYKSLNICKICMCTKQGNTHTRHRGTSIGSKIYLYESHVLVTQHYFKTKKSNHLFVNKCT